MEPTIEHNITGTFGTGIIRKHSNGRRDIEIQFANGQTVIANSQQVDLQAVPADTLTGAVFHACNSLGSIPLFEKILIKGTRALISCYRRTTDPTVGYASVIKKGVPALRFSLKRIDLTSMKAKTIQEALRKTAFETGTIRLHD